jgi:glycosyltransferase involved in cell wall biosynthesis
LRKITIITVTYNAFDALSKTIENLKTFRERYYEYIIIDGGSKDGTLNLINCNLDVVDKWVSEKDRGIYDAMNKGWAMADHDSHIIYLGAGDKLLSLPVIKEDDCSVIIYGHVIMEKSGVFKSKVDLRLIFGNTIHHQALLIPKAVHPNSPFDLRFKTYADFDFNQRLYKSNVCFKYDETFVGYASFGGVSEILNIQEMTSVTLKNFGVFVMLFSYLYLSYQKCRYFLAK